MTTLYLRVPRPAWDPLIDVEGLRPHPPARRVAPEIAPAWDPLNDTSICGPHFAFWKKNGIKLFVKFEGAEENGGLLDCSQRRRRHLSRLTAPTFFFSGDSRPPLGNPTSSRRLVPLLVWGKVTSFVPVMAYPFLKNTAALVFEWWDHFFSCWKLGSFDVSFSWLLCVFCFANWWSGWMRRSKLLVLLRLFCMTSVYRIV